MHSRNARSNAPKVTQESYLSNAKVGLARRIVVRLVSGRPWGEELMQLGTCPTSSRSSGVFSAKEKRAKRCKSEVCGRKPILGYVGLFCYGDLKQIGHGCRANFRSWLPQVRYDQTLR